MKVLHICTEDSGGAGLCAYRINIALQELGVKSQLLTYMKTVHRDDRTVHSPYAVYDFVYRIVHRFLRDLGLFFCERDILLKQSHENNAFYSSPVAYLDISDNQLVREADIIHFHYVDNFFDQPSFLRKVNKPIVWTLHDENLFYGTAHYHDSILTKDSMEKKYREIKQKMIRNASNLNFVFLSRYFQNKFGEHQILEGRKVVVINNSVDCSMFHPSDKMEMRKKYNLFDDCIYLVFIAANISDSHKGLDKLTAAVEQLANEKIRIIAIGNNRDFVPHTLVHSVGKIADQSILAEYISASDYLVMPSLQEAFSQVPIEAMACGVPVVAFPVSGTDELINPENGIRCDGFDVDDLISGLKIAMSKSYDRNIIRKYVKSRFSPQFIAQQYLDLYNEVSQGGTYLS